MEGHSRLADSAWLNLIKSPHAWLVAGMLAIGGILHYGSLLPHLADGPSLALSSHSMERILFMLPIVYGAFVFGSRGGAIALAVAALLMLPQAVFLAPHRVDALFETIATIFVAGLILLWLEGQQRERLHRQEVLAKLEVARQELSSHIELIKKNERQLAAINEVCRVAAQSLELPHTFHQILNKVLEVTGMDVALIFLTNRNTQELELAAHQGISDQFAKAIATLKMGEGFNGRVAESGELMVVKDAWVDPRLVRSLRKEEVPRSQLMPLQSKGEIIGTLCAAKRSYYEFSPDETELIAAIGTQAGIAIDNARLYREVRASQENYQDLFENASAAMFVHDLQGNVVAANKACVDLTGYDLKELTCKNVTELRAPSTAKAVQEAEDRLLRGEPVKQPYEMRLLRKDGTESILSISTRVIVEDEQPKRFEHVAIDVTQERRMRESLDFYLREILTAQEDERKRIARELHDETGQALFLISQRLDSFTTDSEVALSDEERKYLTDMRGIALQALADMRRLTQDLRPGILDDLGLVAALEWLADDLHKRYKVITSVQLTGTERKFPPQMQLLLFRITQEALSNVRRHSSASAANVIVEFGEDKVRVIVADNGKGFKLPERLSDLAGDGKLGLLGMQERARLLGGTFAIQSELGRGTTVTVELPT